ncbi:CPBP family intramembrane glutamic endopeptidase [Paenibacillus gallinarum]|uniref:CPBP family intramembrane metalloprotease n=1 Tax=Paenibacillus gallinarum TaxID=2762232 RepID=A0ABR8T3P8_9BACL|nr:type II CAAX endopeptidase family protein [Paenibacillus gallinarum]MBD7970382.1 CPBP family intramembrane metalloprotease [Paenibacillus gallinarum]
MNTANSYPIFHWPSIKKMFVHRELYQAIAFFLSPQLIPITVMLGTMYPEYTALINVVSILIGLIILTFAIRVISKRQRKYRYVNRIRILPIIGVFISCIIGLTLITYLYSLIGITLPSQPNQESLTDMIGRFPLIMIFMITILAPVTEELVFRELLPNTLGPSYISFITSSMLFVAIHSPSGIMGWTSYGIMAAGFLYVRLSQKSIYACIAVHIVWNTVSIIA